MNYLETAREDERFPFFDNSTFVDAGMVVTQLESLLADAGYDKNKGIGLEDGVASIQFAKRDPENKAEVIGDYITVTGERGTSLEQSFAALLIAVADYLEESA